VTPGLLSNQNEVGLEVFGLGAVDLVVIVVLHGFGLDRVVDRYTVTAQKRPPRRISARLRTNLQ